VGNQRAVACRLNGRAARRIWGKLSRTAVTNLNSTDRKAQRNGEHTATAVSLTAMVIRGTSSRIRVFISSRCSVEMIASTSLTPKRISS
jgi:hypothetical protein